MRGPRADAGQLGQPLDGAVRVVVRAAIEAEGVRSLRRRQRDDAPGAGGDDAQSCDVIDAQRRYPCRHRCESIQRRKWRDDRFAKRLHEPAGDRRRGSDGHLLTEDCAQAHLESVEGSGHPQTRIGLDGRRQVGIFAEMLRDQIGPRVEIEQRPDAAEQRRQRRRQAVRELDHQRVLLPGLRHPDPARCVSQAHRSRVRVAGHLLDAFERASRQKREHSIPVVRRTIDELQRRRRRLRDRPRALGGRLAQAARRHTVARVERVVEPAQAREAAGEGHFGDRQRRLRQQLLCQQQPPGEQQLNRRYAQLLVDDAANLPRAELELIGDLLEAGRLVELAFLQPLNDQPRDPLRVVHRRIPRCQFGTTTQARTETGALGLLRRVEKAAVGRLRCFHRADRTAIDVRRRDADEEDAVESGIARGQGPIEPAAVLVHRFTIRHAPALI